MRSATLAGRRQISFAAQTYCKINGLPGKRETNRVVKAAESVNSRMRTAILMAKPQTAGACNDFDHKQALRPFHTLFSNRNPTTTNTQQAYFVRDRRTSRMPRCGCWQTRRATHKRAPLQARVIKGAFPGGWSETRNPKSSWHPYCYLLTSAKMTSIRCLRLSSVRNIHNPCSRSPKYAAAWRWQRFRPQSARGAAAVSYALL